MDERFPNVRRPCARSLRGGCILLAIGAMLSTPWGASTARAQPLPGMHGEGTGPKTRRAGATSRPRSVDEKKEAL